MPIYEYKCVACDHRFSVLQRIGEGNEHVICEQCGAPRPIKQFSAFASPGNSGGSTSGSYTDPKGPNATKLSWNFFKNHPKNGDAPNPGDISPPVTAASPAGGTYGSSVSVTLSPNEPATTYYTLDGSTPTVNSLKYSEPISINSSKTIKFFRKAAFKNYNSRVRGLFFDQEKKNRCTFT